MAFTKAQLETLKNSLLASGQPINAATHRELVQKLIDELYDAQSRGNLISGVQATATTQAGDVVLVIRSGQAYLIPATEFGAAGIGINDLQNVVIVDPQDGDVLAYNTVTGVWENVSSDLGATAVPYTGAVGSVNLGEFGLSAGFLKLDTTPTDTPTDPGTIFWDEDDQTVDIRLNGYVMKVGEDLFYPVKNQTGSSIPKGTAVRFAGTLGSSGRLLIQPFLADGTFDSRDFMGVTAEAIANGEDGKVLWFGRIRGVDTSAFSEGGILYASPTVAGGFTATRPTFPENIISVAAVVFADSNNGELLVRPTVEGLKGGGSEDEVAFFDANGNLVTDVGITVEDDDFGLLIRGITVGRGNSGVASNTAVGRNALSQNTTGTTNTAVGDGALEDNTTGSENTAVGHGALEYNTTGDSNTAVGRNALSQNTTGTTNTAVGDGALEDNTTGSENTAIGERTLWNNTTGIDNTAVGADSLPENKTGSYNTSLGGNALRHNIGGSNNVAVGYIAGRSEEDGSPNVDPEDSVYVGNDTRPKNSGETNQIIIGKSAVGNGSNTVTLGNDNITDTYLKGEVKAELIYSEEITVTLSTIGNAVTVKTFATTDKAIFTVSAIPTGNKAGYQTANFFKGYDGTNSIFQKSSSGSLNFQVSADSTTGSVLEAEATGTAMENEEIKVKILYLNR